jgi:hypothetical protein
LESFLLQENIFGGCKQGDQIGLFFCQFGYFWKLLSFKKV